MIVLDMDSSVSPTHGDQEGTAYNGHFGCTCYHPLFVFNQFGDLERCGLRPGNVHSAHEWRDVLETGGRATGHSADFRGDAAFASPATSFSKPRTSATIGSPQTRCSRQNLLKRPVGTMTPGIRLSALWDKPRRVVAKGEWHPTRASGSL